MPDDRGASPLRRAAQSGDPTVCEALVQAGAEPTGADLLEAFAGLEDEALTAILKPCKPAVRQTLVAALSRDDIENVVMIGCMPPLEAVVPHADLFTLRRWLDTPFEPGKGTLRQLIADIHDVEAGALFAQGEADAKARAEAEAPTLELSAIAAPAA
jgi:hypothetical protein